MEMPAKKIIAVSSCLLGHKVRYDSNDKRSSIVETELCTRFHCVPICPEYAVGLGVPRNPMRLVTKNDVYRVVDATNENIDLTAHLTRYADLIISIWPQLCGYIFKARSPSCGLNDTPVFDSAGYEMTKGGGAYSYRLLEIKKSLPAIDEIQLENPELRRQFIRRVERYALSLLAQ